MVLKKILFFNCKIYYSFNCKNETKRKNFVQYLEILAEGMGLADMPGHVAGQLHLQKDYSH